MADDQSWLFVIRHSTFDIRLPSSTIHPLGMARNLLCRSSGSLIRSIGTESHEEAAMPKGDKSKYTDKQKRKAEHIEEGYEDRGVSAKEAKSRAWATVNKESGGGNKSGSGRGKTDTKVSSKKGGKKGGAASASRTAAERSASAKKAAATRKRNREAASK